MCNKFQFGTVLLELTIATALSLWLLSGLLLIYASNQRAGQTIRAMALMQENARVATYLLSQAIRSAGYCGCLPLANRESMPVNSNANTLAFNQATRLIAWHHGVSSAPLKLPQAIARTAKFSSDVLLLQQMVPDFEPIKSLNGYTIKLAAKPAYKPGDNLMLADCNDAILLRVKAISGNNITVTPRLPEMSARSTQLGSLSSVVYYVRDTGRKNQRDQPVMALYRRDLRRSSAIAQEIIEGVEQLQVKFGVAYQHKIVYKVIPQMQAADWPRIVIVQITLLLNSVEPVTLTQNADNLLRRSWTMTAALRQPMVEPRA